MKRQPKILIVGCGIEKIAETYSGNPSVNYVKTYKEAKEKINTEDYDLFLIGYNSKEYLDVVKEIKTIGKHLNTFLVCGVDNKKIIENLIKICPVMKEEAAKECLRVNVRNNSNGKELKKINIGNFKNT